MSHMCPSLLGPTMALVCVCWLRCYLSFLSHFVSVLCWLWNLELDEPLFTCHYCVMAPRTSNGNSWVQVAKCGKTSERSEGKVAQVNQLYTSVQAMCSPLACANGEKFRVSETVACVNALQADWPWEAFRGASRALLLWCLSDGIIMVSWLCKLSILSLVSRISVVPLCGDIRVYLGFCWWTATDRDASRCVLVLRLPIQSMTMMLCSLEVWAHA